jgi:hypothetical protein
MGATPPGLSDEKAARMMIAFRAGSTLRRFHLKASKFEAYCARHPEYGREALPLLQTNLRAANQRKGEARRLQTHCKHGHSLADAFVTHQNGFIKRDCRTCWKIRGRLGGTMKPEALAKVKAAFERGGATVNQILHGRPAGGGLVDRSLRIVDSAAFYRYRRENPEFDRFIAETIANNNSRGQQIRYARERARAQTAARRAEANDYQKILAMFPMNFPGRNDAAQNVFVALYDGSLKREDVRARVKLFMIAENRAFPTNYAKFGDSPLVSLDEAIFVDGATTRGDAISRGLWD